jgi:uncharacterized membrane protein YfcA
VLLAILIAAVSALYATAGQAGGTGFVAAMALTSFPTEQIRPTASVLNVVAAGYATLRLWFAHAIDWPLLGLLVTASLPAAFLGGYIALGGSFYSALTGFLLVAACVAMIAKRNTGNRSGEIALPITRWDWNGHGICFWSVWYRWRRVPRAAPPFVWANAP